MKKLEITLLLIFPLTTVGMCQNSNISANNKIIEKRYFISTSLWSLSNFGKEPTDFYEFNFGRQLSAKDNLILTATTWKYWEPLGIPYGNDKKYNHIEDYPGFVRAYGVGLIYQRFIMEAVFYCSPCEYFSSEFLQ